MNQLWNLFWIFLIIISLWPAFQRRALVSRRMSVIRRIEGLRKSRVITLIHRQETMRILGFPIMRFIDINDSEEVLRAIRLTPVDMPIDLIIHTPGGLVLSTEQIALALLRHQAKVTVFVPHYAMSGGTLLCLTADEVVMDRNAVLGNVDPQVGAYPAVSILKAVRSKAAKDIDDETLILADVAEKALTQIRDFVCRLLTEKKRLGETEAGRIADVLTSGLRTHDYPLTFEEISGLGISARDDLPREIYDLMDLFPQAAGRRPSVQYIPVPYGPKAAPPKARL